MLREARVLSGLHGHARVPQVLTVFHEYEQALLGLIVMVFMIFLRRGIVPSVAAILKGWRK